MKIETLIKGGFGVGCAMIISLILLKLAIIVGIIWVIWHFVSKWW